MQPHPHCLNRGKFKISVAQSVVFPKMLCNYFYVNLTSISVLASAPVANRNLRPHKSRQRSNQTMSRNTKKDAQYFPSLRRLMEHKDGRLYPATHTFSDADLLTITPAHICSWFCLLAYGSASPATDALPTECRSSTLLGHKKMISHFHPRKDVQWDSIWGEGNPTRLQRVNALTGDIKVHKVRLQGVPSQARRPFSLDKF